MRRSLLWVGILLICLIVAGCGGGGGSYQVVLPGSDDPSLFVLNNGKEANLTSFNGKKVHALITSVPLLKTKPEGNDLSEISSNMLVYYRFDLATTAFGSTGSLAPPSLRGKVRSSRWASWAASASKQAENDRFVRTRENEILSRGLKQLSRSSSYLKSAPAAIVKGTEWDGVYVYKGLADLTCLVDLTCCYVSEHAYFFVDQRDVAQMDKYMEEYAQDFESIYKTTRDKFGTENDVDGNGRIIIVFSRELSGGLLGYFNAVDKFSKTYFQNSNEGDIIYITTTADFQGDIVKATLAHEFQHMIYFDQHYNRGVLNSYTWLNEALSQAAEYYSGYLEAHEFQMAQFLYGGYVGLSLTHWTDYNYGYGALFIRYLIDQYGDDDVIRKMCATNKVGIAAVEAATGVDFNILFANFVRALVMSGTDDSADKRYRFKSFSLQALQPDGRGGLISADPNLDGEATKSGWLYPYEIQFYSLDQNVRAMRLSWDKWIHGVGFGLSR